ncbi:MAG: hypothetical protein NC098_07470 [Lachnoclostridium sp.]|nr:hypothetical protein [Lachnoclostridium sp.]
MKTIPHPELKSATRLTAAQLNHLHFGGEHTRLTPSYLKSIATASHAVKQA